MIHSSQHTEGLPSDQKEQNTQEEATRQVRFHGVPEGSREIAQMSLALLDPQLYDKVKEYRERLVDQVDETNPNTIVASGKYYFTEERFRPKLSIFDSVIYQLQSLPGIVNPDPSEVEKENKRLTMEELTTAVISAVEAEEEPETTIPGLHLLKTSKEIIAEPDKDAVYIKILITETEDIVLYESPSLTMLKEDADAIEKELEDERQKKLDESKKSSEDATVLGSMDESSEQSLKVPFVEPIKRMSHAEAQTSTILYKTKAANTDRIKKIDQSSFVSNYDMWDTYADLEASTKEVNLDGEDKTVEITTFTKDGMEHPDQFLSTNKNFKKSAMIIERLLAGNIFGDRQKRFRNFKLPDPYDKDVKYLYRLDTLWVYKVPELLGKAVASASWCTRNGDLLAVAYGVYGFTAHEQRKLGYVCIWSIKNPVNPERRYTYTAPVTSVRFSRKSPQLLAIGLYDGRVEIRDITQEEGPPIAKSDRKTSPGFEPVMQIEWVETNDEKEIILTALLDGTIMKYTMITGMHLLGQKQMTLDRVEGVVEGLAIAKKKTFLEADRHPQALCLKMHPSRKEVYFVGTDEGCLHRCSIYFSHQHTGVMQAHQGGIYAIEYSPWSPKIFLTCGADWKLRIWTENIFEPILELSHDQEPFQCAVWSPIHSTILATCTRNSVQLWDLRRKNMKPASEHSFDSTSTLTIIKFSNCGRSIVVGDADGKVHVCALEDMPFPPHFQYDELEGALNRILEANENLHKQFQELGYLGY